MATVLSRFTKDPWQFFLWGCWIFVLAVTLGKGTAGMIEGKYFPVVTEFNINGMTGTKYGTLIDGTFQKNRRCDFQEYEWYLVDTENNKANIEVDYLVNDAVRKVGTHSFKNVLVHTTPEKFDETVGYVVHRCHPVFDTLTKVKPHAIQQN